MPKRREAMTAEEHVARHKLLHEMFDELLADFLFHNSNKLPSNTTLTDLMKWSFEQTKDPTPIRTTR